MRLSSFRQGIASNCKILYSSSTRENFKAKLNRQTACRHSCNQSNRHIIKEATTSYDYLQMLRQLFELIKTCQFAKFRNHLQYVFVNISFQNNLAFFFPTFFKKLFNRYMICFDFQMQFLALFLTPLLKPFNLYSLFIFYHVQWQLLKKNYLQIADSFLWYIETQKKLTCDYRKFHIAAKLGLYFWKFCTLEENWKYSAKWSAKTTRLI